VVGPTVFCSYAQEDDSLCRELEEHLAGLQRDGVLRIWHRRRDELRELAAACR
jgi:hypothetical protein